MRDNDLKYMKIALQLAKRGLGNTAPNPSVGCVIVKNDKIVGRGYTARGGRPHAETIALEMAGENAKGAMVYVTLEPCSHQGQTPPCAEALVDAGVSRVVVATEDISSKVDGKGIEVLENAGIEIEVGLCENEAVDINEGFFSVIERKRPFVTLKLATTLDGKIATATGDSKWITGKKAQRYAHLLRKINDGILVGSGTVKHDDPMLNCRIKGLENCSPIRIVADSKLRISESSAIIKTAKDIPVMILATKMRELFNPREVEVVLVSADEDGRCDMKESLEKLAEQGITRLLVEGGASIAASLIKRKLVDKIIIIHAPKIVGKDGLPSISDLGIEDISQSPMFHLLSVRKLGDDVVSEYEAL